MPQPPQNSAWSKAEAQTRIEAARSDGATVLDLSGLQLRAVPLKELSLYSNCLINIPDWLGDLTAWLHRAVRLWRPAAAVGYGPAQA